MNTIRAVFAAGLCALALAACATQAESAPEASPPQRDVLIADPPLPPQIAIPTMTAAGSITLFEGGCYYYSSCTTFEITLRPDGSYTVSGQNGAAGREGQIGADVFAATEAFLANNGFSAFPERMDGSDPALWRGDNHPYPCMNHAPGTVITRRPGDGTERGVYWNQGCRSEAMSAWTQQLRAVMQVEAILNPPPG
jgi:hypothetical protein